MKKDRVPEIHFYEWRASTWATSETRQRLDATGRGIYRELIDQCNTQGSFPDEPEWICGKCACTPEELEKVWPMIEKHFPISNRAGRRWNIPANIFRREYFGYIKRQQNNRKKGLRKPNKDKYILDGGSTKNDSGSNANEPNGNGNGNGNGNTTAIQTATATTNTEVNATQPQPKPQLIDFREYPKTATAIHKRFATADTALIRGVVTNALQAYLAVEKPKTHEPTDADIALAVDIASRESGSRQTSPGLYLRTVPTVVANWARSGKKEPGQTEYFDPRSITG